MNVIEIRKSTRNFKKIRLATDVIEKINYYLNEPHNLTGAYGTPLNFEVLIENDFKEKEKIGTYGFIKNAAGFIIGSCANESRTIFEFGFALEGLVLYLTELQIGTCWLGGTFKRQEVMSTLEIPDGNIIPAIIAIGYPEQNEHFRSWAQRKLLSSDHRKPEDTLYFYETFEQPLTNKGEIYKKALAYMRLAPSAKNKQPWRIVVSSDLSQVHFYIASALADNKAYACEPEYIDIGIAYKHFKIGIDTLGFTGKLKAEEPTIQNPKDYIYITTWSRD